MEKLVTVKDVSERYGCSLPTARKYIRQCNPHMEAPLATYKWAFEEWEQSRLAYHAKTSRKELNAMKKRASEGKIFVPRRRT